ncbi:MAG: rRNA maturation RNase YbeY [Candidatus Omnitrophica bacterium]|nr:rRNA maturation RNase YbeY [Candidatus Omnitrophota bacterium]
MEIKNLQNLKRINQSEISLIVERLLNLLSIEDKYISLVFCDNRFIKKLNYLYFGKDLPTDVISFNLQDKFNPNYLGEVIVSVEEALVNSKVYGTDWKEEIILYIIHGLLHILGYDDNSIKNKKIMEAKQRELLHSLYNSKQLR